MSKLLNFHPILFQPEMVAANLDGRKTETRIIVKPQPECINSQMMPMKEFLNKLETMDKKGLKTVKNNTGGFVFPHCRYGQPGDILWVRENFFNTGSNEYLNTNTNLPYCYQADVKDSDASFVREKMKEYGWKYKPSIHMPNEACRMFLLLKEVKVERLQDISEESAISEGVEKHTSLPGYKNYNVGDIYENEYYRSAKDSYKSLIQKIHGEEIWQQNPWVWVLKYEVLSTNGIGGLNEALLDRKYDGAVVARSIHNFKHNIKS
jgi:hypothetical protein